MSFQSNRLVSKERCLPPITSKLSVNRSRVNYARKRPLTIGIVKDNVIAVADEVRLFH